MTYYQEFIQALENATAACGNLNVLSKQSGIAYPTLRRWIKQEQIPSLQAIQPLMPFLEPFWGSNLGTQAIDFAYVPKVEATAGAGASLETSGDVEGLYAFRKQFLSCAGISAANAVMMDVVGDSMEPLIMDGDTILIDQHDKNVQDGKIYVVTLGEELRCKRIYKGLNGLILRSENSRYPDIIVSDADIDSLIIQGRVRWFGRVI